MSGGCGRYFGGGTLVNLDVRFSVAAGDAFTFKLELDKLKFWSDFTTTTFEFSFDLGVEYVSCVVEAVLGGRLDGR